MTSPVEKIKPEVKGPAIVRPIELEVRHSRCRHGKPLVTVNGLPGEFDVELRPEQLRKLAAMLIKVADACEPMDGIIPAGRSIYREYQAEISADIAAAPGPIPGFGSAEFEYQGGK